MTRNRDAKIVVGIDGSESSFAALTWAARWASSNRAQLEVISAWNIPPADIAETSRAKQHLDEQVALILGPETELDIVTEIINGPPDLVLTHHAEHALLLVVGCRNPQAPEVALLGSVSSYVATHARCPVVVVHGFEDGDDTGSTVI